MECDFEYNKLSKYDNNPNKSFNGVNIETNEQNWDYGVWGFQVDLRHEKPDMQKQQLWNRVENISKQSPRVISSR